MEYKREYNFSIDLDLTSLNEIYGSRWKIDSYRKYIISQVESQNTFKDVEILNPVDFEFRALLTKSQRAFDVMNYASTIKIVEDYMVTNGVIAKDSPLFVRSHKTLTPIKSECCIDNCKFTIKIIEYFKKDDLGIEIIPDKNKKIILKKKKKAILKKKDKRKNPPKPLKDYGDLFKENIWLEYLR